MELLDAALDEGRLDPREHDTRVRAAQAAKRPGELAKLVADLPDRPGVWEWTDHLRIRATDRQRATTWLGDGLAAGVLTAEEHERRLAKIAAAVTYESLRKQLDGVPGPPGTVRERLFVTATDRERLTARLARALADDRIGADDHAELRDAVAAAKRYGDLDRASAALDESAGQDPRAEVIRRLDAAYADGQIGAADHERRTSAAKVAGRNADLRALLDGLTEPAKGATPEWIVGRAKSTLAKHLLTDAERKQTARALERALHEGRLDLDEYDERVRDAYAAQEAAQLRPLLVDVVAPAGAPERPDKAARRSAPGRLLGVLAVAGALVAGTLGVVAWRSGDPAPAPGTPAARTDVKVAWAAPLDRPTGIQAVGNWVTGSALIRARTDQVTAYDLADGRVRWTFPVPGRNELCTMSRETEDGIGLIGFGPDDSGVKCTTIAALDLGTGQLLWQRSRKVYEGGSAAQGAVSDEVGIAAGTAIVKEPAGFVAVGLRDNKEKWRTAVRGESCTAYSVTASGTDVALLSACEDKSARLSMVDPASGRVRFGTDLRLHDDDHLVAVVENKKTTIVLSTTPLVVRTSDDGSRTRDAVISFDGQGRRRATVPLSQDDLDVAPHQLPAPFGWSDSFIARPPRAFAVFGDTLIAPVMLAGGTGEDRLAAFSLADGRRLWQVELGAPVATATADGERFVVATTDARIRAFSAADGRALGDTRIDAPEDSVYGPYELWPAGDRYAISHVEGSAGPPPALVLG
ncbi:hypothetical protein Prum_077580 [Phytohabitans rumicis]|uniref:PQQ-binding-like beta-propeller repeat protein n=1 Tax=Phytohabitans rumicis TaxID=1076125 RepID=A0A6V8LIW8_9ACTN|nr:hypothetical protein Prum_077580 [Phytohabitans rumicis]